MTGTSTAVQRASGFRTCTTTNKVAYMMCRGIPLSEIFPDIQDGLISYVTDTATLSSIPKHILKASKPGLFR